MLILLRHARIHVAVLGCGLVLALLASAAGLAQPLAARHVIEALGAGGSLLTPVIVLCLLVVAGAAANGAQTYLLTRTGERIVLDLRRSLGHRLLRLRVTELDRRPAGDLVTRATSDTSVIRAAASTAPVQFLSGVIGIGGAVTLMAVLDIRLFGVTMVVLVAVAGVIGFLTPRIRRAAAQMQSSVGEVGAALDGALAAARTMKAAGAEAREGARVDRAAQDAYGAGERGARWHTALVVTSELSLQLSFLVVLGFGGAFVAAGSLGIATLVAFLLYLFYLTAPLSELVTAVSTLQQGLGAAGRVAELETSSTEPDVDPAPGPAAPDAGTGDTGPPTIVFDRVSFSYPGRDPVLHDVSFRVTAGSRGAVVGPSGAGKSTLFSLLMRFHEPDRGRVVVGGTDVTAMSRFELRRRIGYVEQDVTALAGTLRDNLRYAAPGAGDEELQDIVVRARLDGLVERLPQGLDSPIGTRGVALSGGERQRLAIARALLRSPEILLLDEATAHLDMRIEAALHQLLSRRRADCTVLVIAHRIATVRDADHIVIMEQGRVRACGSHEALIETDALYRGLTADGAESPALSRQ